MYNAGCVASVAEITTCTNDSWPCPSKICSKCFLEFPEVLPVVLSIIILFSKQHCLKFIM